MNAMALRHDDDSTHTTRREWLAHGAALAVLLGGSRPSLAHAEAAAELAFDATSFDDAMRALGGALPSTPRIALQLPAQADNGAFVSVSATSTLPGTEEISFLVATNPNPMVVRFTIPEGTEPFVGTRIKVAESGRVYAIVRARGQLYASWAECQVTTGGCA